MHQTDNRYILIKSWGFGFYSDVIAVLGSLLLAEITNRTPIVYWGKNSLFGSFENFFEPITLVGIDHLSHQKDFFPPKWNRENLAEENLSKWSGEYSRMDPVSYIGREEEVAVCDFFVGVVDLIPLIPPDHAMYRKSTSEIYRWLINKYLRPHEEILRRVDAFQRKNLQEPYVAMHIRGSDKVGEITNLDEVNMSFIKFLEGVDPKIKIFLLTDDARWLNITRQKFGNSRVVATDCKRTHTNTGTHHLYACGEELGKEVMVDAYLASRAGIFIGNGTSGVSLMVSHMKDWQGRYRLNCEPLWPSARRLKK
ncbi:MAG: O-fucosyltransferase family protein [Gammaproteobacteria bacterium]